MTRHSVPPLARALVFLLAIAFALVTAVTPALAQVSGNAAYRPGEVIIRWAPGATAADRADVRGDLGATTLHAFTRIGATHERLGRFTVDQAVRRYTGDPRITYIEPDYVWQASNTPDDPLLPQLWGMHNTGQTGGIAGADISALAAWNETTGSSDVLVAIIDTGMDYTHPDLATNVWVNPGEVPGNGVDDDGNGYVDDVHGWDFVNGDSDPMDDNGHGTHCAGTIGGIGDNGEGVVGVCWSVRMMPLKFLDAYGSGSTDAAIGAIEYATRMGVRVMSNSWGGGGYSLALHDAIAAAQAAGILFVAAAGNATSDNDALPSYPASYDLPGIVAVASTDAYDQLSWFSNWGATTVDLAAPGSDILSCAPGGGYVYKSGTSMATPHVAGAAALVLARYPALDWTGAKARLLMGVDTLASLKGKVLTNGRLDVARALAPADSVPPDAIADVTVTRMGGDFAELRWTATGDDGASGRAARYDVRWSTAPILTPADFAAATPVAATPDPQPAGAVETLRIDGLPLFGTLYHFALIARDDFGLPSPLSNDATGTTLGAPVIAVAPDSVAADLFTGGKATRVVTVSNAGASELRFRVDVGAAAMPAAVPPALRLASGTSVAPLATGYAAGRAPSRRELLAEPDATSSTGDLRVAVLASGGDPSELANVLAAFPDIAAVDVLDISGTAPALSQLQAYQAAIVVVNNAPGDPVTLGNVLADYADGGGGLVFTLASFISGFSVQGRIATGGYLPFTPGSGPVGSSTLGAHDATHPILQGVSALSGDLLGATTLAAGAAWVADWASGQPLVATHGTNVVGVNAFFGGAGYWTGDMPTLMHNALFWSTGTGQLLTVTPREGVVPAGGSTALDVLFDAAGRVGGDYDRAVLVQSNDPVTPVARVAAHLHVTGAPDLVVTPDTLDFGARFLGVAWTETLLVRNGGTDLLTVSAVTTGPAPFAAPAGGFTLAPDSSRVLLITFAPATAGDYSGTLTIASDDPDPPSFVVPLHGAGVVAPAMQVAPDSLSAELFTGQTATRTLTVTNDGGSTLEVQVSTGPRAPAAKAARAEWARALQPGESAAPAPSLNERAGTASLVPLAGTYTGTYLAIGLSDYGELMPFQYPIGNEHLQVGSYISGYTLAYITGGVDHVAYSAYGNRSGLTPVSYQVVEDTPARLVVDVVTRTTDGVLTVHRRFTFERGGKGVGVLTRIENSGAATAFSVVYKEYADWDVDGDYSDDGFDYDRPRNMVRAWDLHHAGLASARVPDAMDLNGWGDYVTRTTVVDYPTGPVVPLDGLALLHFELGVLPAAGSQEVATAYGTGNDVAELENVIARALSMATWLKAAPTALSVPAHSSQDVTVTFDARSMAGGEYEGLVTLAGNDPLRPVTDVPAHLHVIGVTDIAVTPLALAFGTRLVGTALAETVMVANVGTDALHVSGVSITPSAYTVDGSAFVLNPGQSRALMVTFAPPVAGSFPGTLTVHSDDPDEADVTVTLDGAGALPPRIVVAPDSLTATLYTGDRVTRAVTVSDPGGLPLHWSLSVSAASAVTPPPYVPTGAERADPVGLSVPTGPSGLAGLLAYQLERAAAFTLFYDDMEHGTGGWTRQVYGVDDLWHQSTLTSNSPSHSWWCGIESSGTYATGSRINTAAVTPVIDLHGATAPITLQFAERYDTEPGWDYCMVDVATDTGATWTPLRGGTYAAPSGSSGGWRLTQLDLSSYAGRSIRIRFYFDTIDGGANAYPGWFFDDVLVTAASPPWLRIDPTAGTVPTGGSQSLVATIDAAGLLGGDYRAQVAFASDDPFTPTALLPAHLHVTGAPNIAVTPTALAFGTRFVGATRSDTVRVSNTGSETLVVSAVAAAPAVYSVPTAGFSLAPGASRTLTVTFAPLTAGAYPGTLTLTSNDADTPSLVVPLSGTCVDPPVIAVSPDGFQRLVGPNQAVSEPMTIGNIGLGPLTWSLSAVLLPVGTALTPTTTVLPPAAPGDDAPWAPDTPVSRVVQSATPLPARPGALAVPTLADALAALELKHGYVTSRIPSRFDFLEGTVGTYIADGGQDMFDYGNYIKTNKAGPVSYTDGAILYASAFGSSYFTRKYPGLFVLGADLVGVTTFTVYGDLGADGTGVVDGGALSADIGGISYLGYVKRVYNAPGSASVNHLIILPNPGTTSHGYYLDTNNDYDQVSVGSATRVYDLLFAGDGGAYLDNAAMLDIMRAFLGALLPMPQWLTLTPASGTTAARGSSPVTVGFDSHGLPNGTYDANIVVNSDDPAHPSVVIPAQMEVGTITAAEVALVSAGAEAGVAHVTWRVSGLDGGAMTVQRRAGTDEWSALRAAVPDGEGMVRLEDRDVAPATRYGYRLAVTSASGTRTLGETWVEVPVRAELALRGLQPNPAARDLTVAFSLPDGGPATLEVLDLAGRRLRAREVGALGAGPHVISLGPTGELSAGVYLVRLRTRERSLMMKGVVIE